MATTNPVSQVLVTSGNQSPLAAGNPISALAVGQIGVFNYHTGLSLGAASVVGDTREIFIAVGIDPDGVGSLQDINKSAGQVIQVRNMKSYTLKGYMADAPKIVDLFGFSAKCEKEYGIKLELRNAEVYMLNGYNQFSKTFMFKTGCCEDQCADCGDGDCIELVTGLADQINADPDELVTATYFSYGIEAEVTAAATANGTLEFTVGSTAYTADVLNGDSEAVVAGKIAAAVNAAANSPYTAVAAAEVVTFYLKTDAGTGTFTLDAADGTGVTVGNIVASTKTVVADPDAFQTANPGACLGLRLTSNPVTIKSFCSINLDYHKMRGTDVIVSLVEGFTCNGALTTVQELTYSQGKGTDIQQLEYVAGGLNGKPGPYRVSTLTNMPRKGFVYFAATGTNYQQLILSYDQMSVGGWLEYLNNLETVIAIPCADTTTLTELVAILDAIFTQFSQLTSDAALLDCTNVETSAINNVANDGIESLS